MALVTLSGPDLFRSTVRRGKAAREDRLPVWCSTDPPIKKTALRRAAESEGGCEHPIGKTPYAPSGALWKHSVGLMGRCDRAAFEAAWCRHRAPYPETRRAASQNATSPTRQHGIAIRMRRWPGSLAHVQILFRDGAAVNRSASRPQRKFRAGPSRYAVSRLWRDAEDAPALPVSWRGPLRNL